MDMLTGGKLNTAIASFKTNEKKRDNKVHTLACSALNHANEHGDIRPLSQLYHAFGKASNPNEFRYWVGQMCPSIKWDKDALAFAHKKDQTSMGTCDMERAIANPYWTLDKVKEKREFDAVKDAKGVQGILKRHQDEAVKAGENELADAYGKMLKQAEETVARVLLVAEQSKVGTGDSGKRAVKEA